MDDFLTGMCIGIRIVLNIIKINLFQISGCEFHFYRNLDKQLKKRGLATLWLKDKDIEVMQSG